MLTVDGQRRFGSGERRRERHSISRRMMEDAAQIGCFEVSRPKKQTKKTVHLKCYMFIQSHMLQGTLKAHQIFTQKTLFLILHLKILLIVTW